MTDRTPSVVTARPVRVLEVPDDSRSDKLIAWVLDDPQLTTHCAAAVDSLEVAARLETHGMSSRVAIDSFGYPDVFSAADVVHASLEFTANDPPDPPPPPRGGPLDLLRGALYALPALFLPVMVVGFAFHTSWWVLPIGLTVAWGTGQAFATCAWALRGRNDHRSDSLVAVASIVVSAVVCLGCAALASWALSGNATSTILSVGVATYLAASGILLFQQAEWLLAACMVPATVGTVLTLRYLPVTVSHRAASWAVTVTVILVVVAANRHLLARRWRLPVLNRADRLRSLKFCCYGIGCGLLISAFIGFAADLDKGGEGLILAVWPLLLTLGLMEWQLRTFRSRATTALSSSFNFLRFSGEVRSAFVRSVGIYVTVLVGLSAVCVVIGASRHDVGVPLLVCCVGALGLSFFLALVLASSGQINLVLMCWVATFTVGGIVLGAIYAVRSQITPVAGLVALLVATVVSITVFAVLSSRVLTSPLSY